VTALAAQRRLVLADDDIIDLIAVEIAARGTRPVALTRAERQLAARTAIGMPAKHPELVTRRPGRGEWRQLTAWLAEMWPNDEYTAIVAEAWRQDRPPEIQG
jgi:hypothetical protein